MDLRDYRDSPAELARTADMMALVPTAGVAALDVGARDGFFSSLLAERFEHVVALDLQAPTLVHERITCVQGDVAALAFPDAVFDLVFCAEVLEHLPEPALTQGCRELARVARDDLVIGVPYKQDLRVGRTRCHGCGEMNPPWGHVNRFDEHRLAGLFPDFQPMATSLVGSTRARTNALSTRLMDFAGNPFGTYQQEEPCVRCGATLQPPGPRNLAQKLATRCAHWLTQAQRVFVSPHGNWIHMHLRRREI